MISRLALGLGFVLVSCTTQTTTPDPSNDLLVSSDCKSWRKPTDLPSAGFFKQGVSISYVDYPNRIYAIFDAAGGDPFVFDYSTPGWVHVSSKISQEAYRADLKYDDDHIGSMMAAITAAAQSMAKKNRWNVYPEKGAYFAWFMGTRCPSEPKALGASCRFGQPCELVGKNFPKTPGRAEVCLRELGFTTGELRESLETACKSFSSPEGRNRISSFNEKALLCPEIEPIGVRKINAATCVDLPAFFEKIDSVK